MPESNREMTASDTRPRRSVDIRPECDAVIEDRDGLADHRTEIHNGVD